MNIQEENGFFVIDPPKRPKKLTGTRFASCLGLNRWNTPFQTWCEITRAYSVPFEDTQYTLAGKAIEPKQLDYLHANYGFNVIVPEDIYGNDYFAKTKGDFYPDEPIFGGMWDGFVEDDGNKKIIECKTTKRAEDWLDADGNCEPPVYYAMQAALYAYLSHTEDVVMIVSFLNEKDYSNPSAYEVTADNTAVCSFRVHDKFPDFDDKIARGIEWWNNCVETGISPEFDETLDAEYLKGLRTNVINSDDDVNNLLNELAKLNSQVEAATKSVQEQSKRIKEIKDNLKKYAMKNRNDAKYCEFSNGAVKCTLTTSEKLVLDEELLRQDDLFDKYLAPKEITRFNVSYL